MRPFRIALLVISLAAPSRAQDADWAARLSAAIARAIAQNPEITGMEARIAAAGHRAGQSSALPDPQLDLAFKDFPVSHFSPSRDDFTMEVVGLQQTFPGAGKRPARQALAEAELAGASASHEDHRVRLAAEVADAYFLLGEIDARTAIMERSRERLKRVAASASERYRVGKGAQADVLRSNLEVTAAEEKLVGLRGERRMAEARWNALQALRPGEAVAPTALPPEEPSLPAESALLGQAIDRSPLVAVGAADVRRAEEELELARVESRPDITAAAYYAHRIDYEDLAGFGVSLTLPFAQDKRLKERQAERDAELSGSRANLEMIKNDVGRGVAEAYAELDRSIEQARLYRSSILPQAETNASAAAEAYTVGQVDFLTYVRAAIDRDTYETELAMRRAAAWRAVVAIQKASGVPLVPGTPGVEVRP
jgi:outer membrane protein TolC